MECFVQTLRGTVENDSLPILLTPDIVLNRYLDAIEDNTHESALRNLVNGLFEYELYDKLIMFYPVLGDVNKCGVNLIDPSEYQIDTTGLSKTGENLYISSSTKFQVPSTNRVYLGKNDLTVFFASKSSDITSLYRLDSSSNIISNFPYIWLYSPTYNNNMMFRVQYYSAAIINMVTIDKPYTDNVNSWNANVRVVQTICNDKIYALRNGREGINEHIGITDMTSFVVYPDFFNTPECTLRTCGIGHGFTEEDCQHFDSLLLQHSHTDH